MENFVCSEGRPPDGGVPDILMADDVAEDWGGGDMSDFVGQGGGGDHVDIETCDHFRGDSYNNSNTYNNSTLNMTGSEPEDEEDEEEEKEPLSYELAQGNRILVEIMSDANKSLNWHFMEPVDAEGMGLADYYDRVKNPMWLKKILFKFDQREYATITEFAADFRQMLENCYRYNGPDHYVSKRGQKLETVFEQKLGLLSRELREKTSIAATSGKPIEDKIITGTRRRKILTPHDSSDLLNQLRQEEKERERETRRQQVEERRQQQQAFIQGLSEWDHTLLGPGGLDYLKAMWELPQIGHFLFLTAEVLNIGEVMQFELERSFWMPRRSAVMQAMMTSLLSTPYQRTRLESKPPMPYSIWEDKLRTRVRNWYRIFNENSRDTKKTHRKLGLDETFFKVVGLSNPLEAHKFHDLTFYQRIWIVKGLCDWCLETQESVRETLESQPIVEQRQYGLGTDAEGNSYIHFPQFCGQDLRVYRVKPVPQPKWDRPKVIHAEKTSTPKKKGRNVKKARLTPQTQTARLRQSARQAASSTHSESSVSSSDSGISESEASERDVSLRAARFRRRRVSPAPSTQSTGSTAPNTPTKGRSSRTSAAARDWMPRDGSMLSELTGKRGSRSQRLTCAPVNSGASTPATNVTPSGSRESTPVPTGKDSRCSTPSLETSSRASSPRKQTSTRTTGRRKRRRKAAQRGKGGGEISDEEDMDTGSVDGEVNMADGDATPDSSVVDGPTTKLTPPSSSPAPLPPITDPAAEPSSNSLDATHLKDCTEGEDPLLRTPFSSYSGADSRGLVPKTEAGATLGTSVEESRSLSPHVGSSVLVDVDAPLLPGPSDNKDSCDKDTHQEGGPTPTTTSLHDPTTSTDHSQSPTPSDHPVLGKTEVKEEPGEHAVKQEVHQDSGSDGKPPGVLNSQHVTDMPCVGIKSEPSDSPVPGLLGEPGVSGSVTVKSEPMDTGSEPTTEVKTEPLEEGEVVRCEGQAVVKEEGADSVTVKQENDAPPDAANIKQEDLEPEIKFPEVGPFLLVADSVDMLRQLAMQFAEPEPIIEIKGKKEKVLRPPPRKRCVSDLYERLCYLLKELEPWESKLVAVNKKARIKLRKEYDSYIEEQEAKVVEDVWESEESQSEDSENEDSDDNEDEEVIEIKKEPDTVPPSSVTSSPVKTNQKVTKKSVPVPLPTPAAAATANSTAVGIAEGHDPEKSSFGRVRKRKVIPNSYDEPPVNKKGKKGKEKEHSPSPTPNILQSSRAKVKAPQSNIESLRTALSRAKPVSTASALPPGMQLLNIGGQNVLLNTNTNPPVILQTSAPLNLNNLTLLAQLSAKAAAGNSLGSKIVVNSSAAAGAGPVVRPTAPVTTVSGASNRPPQQVIRTLLASGHAPQHPKTRTHQSAVTVTGAPPHVSSAAGAPTPSSAVQQLTFVHAPTSSHPAAVTALSSALPRAPTPHPVPNLAGHSLLQGAHGGGDAGNTRPQFYKYNDLSQMKATIRQQLVKTSQGIRTKTTVSTGSPGNTALSNLIQAGLLPQTPRMTSAMLQPGQSQASDPQGSLSQSSLTQPTLTQPSLTQLSVPQTSPAQSSLPQPSSLQSTPPQSSLFQPVSPQLTAAGISVPVKTESEEGTTQYVTPVPVVSAPVAQTSVVASVEAKPASILSQVLANTGPAPTTPNIPALSIQSPVKGTPAQPQQSQVVLLPTGGAILKSPTNTSKTILHSPPKSPLTISTTTTPTTTPSKPVPTVITADTSGNPPAVKAQLSPEFKEAVKMGIVNEFNIGTLIHSNPGLVKALNNSMRPKYASNVTVKSLLENRALRQKAARQGEEVVSPVKSPPPLTSPADPAVSPYKVENMTLYTQNDKSVGIQLHSRTSPSKQSTPCSITSTTSLVSSQSLVPSAVVQKPKVVQVQRPGGVLQVGTAAGNKAPIQIQAVRTPQGTVLRAPVRQVIVRPGLQAGTQQVVRLVSPNSAGTTNITLQRPTTFPTQTTNLLSQALQAATNPLPQTLSLDEAVKSVVTTVPCSIPTAQMKIVSPFTAPGHQPLRQVTMTTSTMKSPIPSITALTSSHQATREEVPGSNAPLQVTSPTQAHVVPTVVQGASGQKNVILRVVPQQVMTSEGLVNMILPQQVLQQSLKMEGGGAGKLVLQSGKGGLQLVQAGGSQGGLQVGLQSVQQSPTVSPAAPLGVSTQPPTVKAPATSAGGRTVMTVFPPGKQPSEATIHPHGVVVGTNMSPAQVTLTPQGMVSAATGQVVRGDITQQTAVISDTSQGTVVCSPPSLSALPSQTVSVQKPHTQTLQQTISPVKPSVVNVAQPNMRMVSPQLTLSSAGLVPVQVPAGESTQHQLEAQTLQRTQPGCGPPQACVVERRPSPVLLEQTMAEATSSLDLLAAASMLQEAKAPLPTQQQTNMADSRSQAVSGTQLGQVLVQQAAQSVGLNPSVPEGQKLVAVPTSQLSRVVSPVQASETGLTTFQQQQAKAIEQQIKLQQNMLEAQQKHLIRQLTLQQEVALGGSSGVTQGAVNTGGLTIGTVSQPATPATSHTTLPSPAAKATTPIKRTVVPAATTPGSSAPGVQMAGVMASAGGRMVQLRFAVPTGMTVQQLLQTPQFQQQLAALKVSAIHSITTSTVPATSVTSPAVAASSTATSAPVALASAGAGQLAASVLNNMATTQAAASTQARVVTASPAKPASTPTALVTPAKANTTSLQRMTTTGTLQGAVGGSSQQGNKVTVLVNVNGQLMQAQGLSLGNNMRVVGSSGVGLAANTQSSTPATMQTQKLVHAIPQGSKILQTVGSSAQQRLVTASPQTVSLQAQPSTPQKLVIGGSTTPQKIVVRGHTTPQKVVIGRPTTQQRVVVGGPTTPQKVISGGQTTPQGVVIGAPPNTQKVVIGGPATAQKVLLGGPAGAQKVVVGGQQAMLVARPSGGNMVSPVRGLSGLTVHNPAASAVKTNLLTQLSARTPQLSARTPQLSSPQPGGILLTRPGVGSNAASQVIYTSVSNAGTPTTPNNASLPNGK